MAAVPLNWPAIYVLPNSCSRNLELGKWPLNTGTPDMGAIHRNGDGGVSDKFQAGWIGRACNATTTKFFTAAMMKYYFLIAFIFLGGSLSRSDEGGFGRARQNCRAQPDSRAAAKPTEVGGAASGANRD